MRLHKSRTLRVILTLALILAPYMAMPHPTGATLSDYSDLIDDSRPGNDTSHLISFVTSLGVQASETIILTIDDSGDAFDLTSIDFGDMDLAVDSDDDACDSLADETLAATATASDWGVNVDTGTDVITFTAPSGGDPVASGRCVQIEIGDNATGGATNEEINNATAGVYDIDFSGSFGETGTMKIVVIDTITAQVTVDETLTFTVTGQAPAACADIGGSKDQDITTTSTSINYGSANSDTFYDGCQELAASTNAASGYNVTVQESDQLNYSGTDILDGSCTSSCTESTGAAWGTATDNGFGYCMEDITNNGAATADATWGTNGCADSPANFKIFAEKDTDSPDVEDIMSSADGASDTAEINYRLTIPGTQAAGVYTNNIIFVATPTY